MTSDVRNIETGKITPFVSRKFALGVIKYSPLVPSESKLASFLKGLIKSQLPSNDVTKIPNVLFVFSILIRELVPYCLLYW